MTIEEALSYFNGEAVGYEFAMINECGFVQTYDEEEYPDAYMTQEDFIRDVERRIKETVP